MTSDKDLEEMLLKLIAEVRNRTVQPTETAEESDTSLSMMYNDFVALISKTNDQDLVEKLGKQKAG